MSGGLRAAARSFLITKRCGEGVCRFYQNCSVSSGSIKLTTGGGAISGSSCLVIEVPACHLVTGRDKKLGWTEIPRSFFHIKDFDKFMLDFFSILILHSMPSLAHDRIVCAISSHARCVDGQ